LRFGSFDLAIEHRRLARDGSPVAIGGRALGLLIYLVQRPGELVASRELIAAVWPDTFVEEANLRVQMAALRKALGDSTNNPFILTEQGRGYRFVAAITTGPASSIRATPASDSRAFAPPTTLKSLVGREAALERLIALMPERRLVTLVGPGGVGKTALAIALAHAVMGRFEGGACFVDLSVLRPPATVEGAIASALRIPGEGPDAIESLADFLATRRLLLVLDNCEHMIDAVAVIAETLLRACPNLSILTTSREPLRAEGETLEVIASLAAPTGTALDVRTAMESPAVRLFIERAALASSNFSLTDDNAALVGAVCRKLDGLPLAIELAAARVGAFGLSVLATGIDHWLSLLAGGSRTNARHQTLRAMLDWSYHLLTERERIVLARLGVFRGVFDLASATQVAQGEGVPWAEVVGVIGDLTAKSLLSAGAGLGEGQGEARWRLLDTTRAYALEKLNEAGGANLVARRHAAAMRDILRRAEGEWRTRPRHQWWDEYGPWLDDVRAALEWAFCAEGDTAVGLGLTVASSPLWLGLSKQLEYAHWVDVALAAPPPSEGLDASARERLHADRLRLYLIKAAMLFNLVGPGPDERAVLQDALALARPGQDQVERATAEWGLWSVSQVTGDLTGLPARVRAVEAIAAESGDGEAAALAERMSAVTYRLLGDIETAKLYGERSIGRGAASASFKTVYRHDHATAARGNYACTLWLGGHFDQARNMAKSALEAAASVQQPGSLTYVLAFTICPVAFWLDDDPMLQDNLDVLSATATQNGFDYLQDWARGYVGLLQRRANQPAREAEWLAAAWPSLRPLHRDILISIDPGLVTEEDVHRARAGQAGWAAPEILRARALQPGRPDRPLASRDLLLESLALSQRQGLAAFELRAARDLALLERRAGAEFGGSAALTEALARVTEGQQSVEIRSARAALGAWQTA